MAHDQFESVSVRSDSKNDQASVVEIMYPRGVTYRTSAQVIEALSRLFFVEQTGMEYGSWERVRRTAESVHLFFVLGVAMELVVSRREFVIARSSIVAEFACVWEKSFPY